MQSDEVTPAGEFTMPLGALSAVPGLSVVLVDHEQRIRSWSPTAAEIFGVPAEEALGRPAEEVVGTPRTVTGLDRADLRRAIGGSGGWSGTVLCRRMDGSEELLQAVAARVPLGDHVGTLWLSHIPGEDSDAHALGEAFAAAAADRRRLQVVAEAGKLFGSSLDLETVLERVAAKVAEAIGDCCLINLVDESGELLVTRHLHHTDPEREAAFRAAFLGRALRLDESYSAQVYATGQPLLVQPFTPPGRAVPKVHQDWIAASGIRAAIIAPLSGAGTTFGVLALYRDVTAEPYDETDVALCVDLAERGAQALHNARLLDEVVRADTARAAARERLSRAERMEGLGLLAGGVAHDFNNLLGVISLSAELTRGVVPPDGEAAESLSMINDATDRAAGLTRQLLLFSRRQAGQPSALDVRTLLTDLEQLLGRSIGDRIRLELHLGPGPLLVRADRTRLEQVIVNLAVNARDAMPEGGVLRITAAQLLEPDVDRSDPPVPTAEDSGVRRVRIAVTDTGTGMPEEVQAHAFEPFFTTKEVGVGTGLGLATVHGIVTELGGTVRIDSSPGAGTTIDLELPALDPSVTPHEVSLAPIAPASAAGPAAATAPRAGGGEAVLVVEDEERLREPLRRLLEQCGFEVALAVDGADALDQLDRGLVVDIVLTDVVMPRLTGPELASALADRRPGLPVVFMSGYTDGRTTGVVDPARLVHKPFHASELLSALDRALAAAPTARP